MELEKHAALVTGGAVRIGRAVCLALAARGCRLVIHCRRSVAEAEALADSVREAGGEAFVVRSELADEPDCDRLVKEAAERAPGLDLLVNNAAVFHRDSLREATAEALSRELWTNLFVPVLLTRAFARGAAEARTDRGPALRVVNLLDRRIAANETGELPYLLSKKGLAAFTQNAALELAPAVSVNGVAPGAILPPAGEGEEALREKAGPVPLACRCTPGDVARAVLFLLESDTITGQVIFVDGGQHLIAGATVRAG